MHVLANRVIERSKASYRGAVADGLVGVLNSNPDNLERVKLR